MKAGKYRVELETRARNELFGLPKEIIQQMSEVLSSLERDARPPGSKKLTAQEGYRIRKGKYRILYSVDDKERLVRVYRVGHRREVYR